MSNVRGALILVSMGMAVTIGLLGSGVSAASPTPVPAGNVSELVTFVPPSATSVGFTDWGRIRASQGAEDVTGASPMEDKLPVAQSTG